jgi:hypothetical protein
MTEGALTWKIAEVQILRLFLLIKQATKELLIPSNPPWLGTGANGITLDTFIIISVSLPRYACYIHINLPLELSIKRKYRIDISLTYYKREVIQNRKT